MTLERAGSEDHSFSGSRTRGRDPEVLTISTSWLIIITALHTIYIPTTVGVKLKIVKMKNEKVFQF